MKTITEITYGDLAVGHVVLDPNGDEWEVTEKRHGYVGPTIMFAANIRRVNRTSQFVGKGDVTWIKGTYAEPIAVVDQTTGDSVETVGRILQGHIVMEPIQRTGKTARALLAGHLRIHHGLGVMGNKSDGTLAELLALHAAQHTPLSQPGSLPHVHKELI